MVPRRMAAMPPTNRVRVPAPPLALCVTGGLWKVPALLSRRACIRKIQLMAPREVIVEVKEGLTRGQARRWAGHPVCRP